MKNIVHMNSLFTLTLWLKGIVVISSVCWYVWLYICLPITVYLSTCVSAFISIPDNNTCHFKDHNISCSGCHFDHDYDYEASWLCPG